MAFVKIKDGPKELIGKEFFIPIERKENQRFFQQLARSGCFWTIDFAGMNANSRRQLQLIDFIWRCARAIVLKTPVFFNGMHIIELDCELHLMPHMIARIVDLYNESGGNVKFVKDDREQLHFVLAM